MSTSLPQSVYESKKFSENAIFCFPEGPRIMKFGMVSTLSNGKVVENLKGIIKRLYIYKLKIY